MFWSVLACLATLLSTSTGFGAEIGRSVINFPARYEGGSLALSQGNIKATVFEDEVVFLHGNQRLAIPLRSITAVTYGTDVRHRTIFCVVPFMELDKGYYVGLTWTGDSRQGEPASKTRIDAVLKMNGGKYRRFVAVLERLTGLKAVNADKRPGIIRYESSWRQLTAVAANPLPPAEP